MRRALAAATAFMTQIKKSGPSQQTGAGGVKSGQLCHRGSTTIHAKRFWSSVTRPPSVAPAPSGILRRALTRLFFGRVHGASRHARLSRLALAAIVMAFGIIGGQISLTMAQDGTLPLAGPGALPVAGAADEAAIDFGDIAVSGFSGTKLQSERLAPNVDPVTKTVLDPDGATLEILNGTLLGALSGQKLLSPSRLAFKARDIGHVFALAFDNGPDTATPAPALFAASTSAFGLHIVGPDKDGDGRPDRLEKGEPGAKFMEGQFGGLPGGSPGSIWKIDRKTGSPALFADLQSGGIKNSGPGIRRACLRSREPHALCVQSRYRPCPPAEHRRRHRQGPVRLRRHGASHARKHGRPSRTTASASTSPPPILLRLTPPLGASPKRSAASTPSPSTMVVSTFQSPRGLRSGRSGSRPTAHSSLMRISRWPSRPNRHSPSPRLRSTATDT